MSDEELRGLERAALEGGAGDRVRLADALERAGRGSEALALLIEAIREAPADDLLRLGYARILESRGDPRGVFIRLQVEAARLAELDPRRWELELRASGLLGRWRVEWLGGIASLAQRYPRDVLFERGFLARVTLSVADFARCAEELFRREPVAHVAMAPQLGEAPILAACSGLRHVRELDYGHAWLRAAELEPLLRSPHLTALERLRVWRNDASDQLAQAIARSPAPPRLRVLDLANPIGDEGARALAEAPQLAGLERLHIGGGTLSDAGALALVRSPYLVQLRELVIRATGLSPEVARAVAASGLVLERLTLAAAYWSKPWLTPEGARAVASGPASRHLRGLDLSYQRLGDAGAAALAASPDLEGLEELELAGNDFGPEGVEQLARAPALARARLVLENNTGGVRGTRALLERARPLEQLTLSIGAGGASGNKHEIALETAREILSSPSLSRLQALGVNVALPQSVDRGRLLEGAALDGLTRLWIRGTLGDLRGARLGSLADLALHRADLGIEARSLAGWEVLARLRRLALPDNSLRDGLVAIASSLSSQLLELDLSKNGIDVVGARALADSPAARSLAKLDLSGNPLGLAGVEALVRSPDFQELRFLDLTQAGVNAAAAELLLAWPRLADLAELKLDDNDLRENEDVWYDQGAVVGSTAADPVVSRIRARLGPRLSINR